MLSNWNGMRGKTKNQVLVVLVCVIGYALVIRVFNDISWGKAIGFALLIQVFFEILKELQTLRAEMNHYSTCFAIADAELVRVSALTTDLEEELRDLRRELEEYKSSSTFL